MRRRIAGGFDGARLALFQGLFSACAEEMGVTLMRTAHSPNIKERLDHSCALFDGRGRLVAQAAHIPVHLGSMPRAVEAVLERCAFAPGDVVLLNDPYAGGTHLPDLTLVSPVFARHLRRRGEPRPDFLVASRAHHADIGGAISGLDADLRARSTSEGLRIPPVHLVRGGRIVPDVLALVLANVRTARERRADLLAQLGAQSTGEHRLGELIGRHGLATLEAAAESLIGYAARCMRAALSALPRGRWRFADALDDDGLGGGPVRLAVTLVTGGGRLRVDFTGSSAATAGPLNASLAVTQAAVTYAVRWCSAATSR